MFSKISAFFLSLLMISNANAGEQIRIVGSSTVYPFTTVVAEEFGKTSKFKSPIVESTGTGGGFKLFCSGVGSEFPDISNASRAIKDSERELCKSTGVTDILEVKIGYDGIVLANSKKSGKLNLSEKQIFLALARQVPSNGKLINNPYKKWSDIDKSLPAKKIEVYGPPPTSGTRDAFVELVMQKVCASMPEFISAYKDKSEMEKSCQLIREDGAYVEAAENDNLIVQKLNGNPDAVGIFGYSFLEENGSVIQGATIDNVEPDFDSISSGSYPVSRPLFIYVKTAHIGKTAGLKEFVKEFTSKKAMGEEGYLSMKGLIPLHEEEFKQLQADIASKLGK